jgi:hypothetical protein
MQEKVVHRLDVFAEQPHGETPSRFDNDTAVFDVISD